MTVLYNCKHAGDEFRITKFNNNMDVESSYLCSFTECDCPAGVRDTCRHRQMLPKFVARKAVDSPWFYDYDRDGWVQTDLGEALSGSVEGRCPKCGADIDERFDCCEVVGVTAGTATGSVDIAGGKGVLCIDPRYVTTVCNVEPTPAPAKPFRRGL